MREILFRGKRIDTGEWVYGSLVETEGHCFIHDGSYNVDSETWGLRIGYFQEVIPETVGQYTGLDDKKGNKIFEGDVYQRGSGVPISFEWWNKLACVNIREHFTPNTVKPFAALTPYVRSNLITQYERIGNIHGEEGKE